MPVGLIAKKLGMAELFNEQGRAVAVTVLEAGPCTVTQVKDPAKDGYQAVQVGFEPVKESKLAKAQLGHFKKAGSGPFRYVREFRLGGKADGDQPFAVGQQLTVELFKEGELVDVTGVSIGKGFQGGMKRWHWKGGPRTHGSTSHRRVGSIGSTTTPGRVFKGHHLPGHMGNERVTVQNLRVMKVDQEANLLVIQGTVPGPERRLVLVKKSIKKAGVIVAAKGIQEAGVEDEEKGKSKGAAKAKAAAKKK